MERMMIYKKLSVVAATVILMSGCATVETESWQNCAIGGALLGGAAGGFVDGVGEVAVGVVAGGTTGGLLCDTTILEKAGVEPDTDGDGVVDSRDECPNTLPNVEVGKSGCTLDSDNDSVADYKDKCPNSVAGAVVNELGCVKAWVLEGVNFHTDSADLTEVAKENLLPIATAHHEHHGDVDLLISGHTDSQGSAAYNQVLSQKRAEAVVAFMVENGCEAAKLTAVGSGESQAIADNGTKEGRAKNRRVELSVK